MIRCGGKCGNPSCTYEGTQDQVNGHMGSVKSKLKRSGSGGPVKDARATPSARPEASPYPTFQEWTAAQKADAAKPGAPGQAPPIAPAAPHMVEFDTTGVWMAFGEVLDATILKDSPHKIRMTETKAKVINDSLKGMFISSPPPVPIAVPWYAPFLVTFTGVIVVPLAFALLPVLIKKVKERREDRGEASRGVRHAPASPEAAPVAIPVLETWEGGIRATYAGVPVPEAKKPQAWREPQRG